MYRATIQYISRGQQRGGYQWSTKSTTRVLRKLGFEPEPITNLIYQVTFIGNRDYIIETRQLITRRLRSHCSPTMIIKFRYKEVTDDA